jgi:hypothetical protein
MSDEVKESRLARVKQHLKDNKQIYLVGAGCLGAGYLLRPGVVTIVDAFNIKYKSSVTNIVTTELARRGHPGYLVKCLETGEVFASKRRAAEALDINRFNLNEHLKGVQPDVDGFHFEVLGEAV